MPIKYHDFDLLIERSGKNYKSRVIDSPAGEASTRFQLPFSHTDVENFFVQIGHSRLIETSQIQKMRTFGQELFEAIFTGNVRDKFRESLNEVNRNHEGLRIRLRIANVPELAILPWEFMYDASLSRFLTLSIETPLVRYLEIPRDIQPLNIQPPLKILAVISSPRDFPTLNVQREWDNLQEALKRLETRKLVHLTRLEKPTLQVLQRQLRRGEYHIFHFIGHGVFSKHKQDGQLLFEDELKGGDPVSSRDLGILLHDHRHLRLAVLNACEGARTSMEDQFSGTAQSLMRQGLPAVIAMQFRITDIAAITLAREFYAALADGYPVDAALTEARKTIKTHGNDLEWGTPVLYMRSPNGAIFDIKTLSSNQGEVPLSPPADPGMEKRLGNLYTEGLEAFYLKEWNMAVQKFKAIINEQPDFMDTADKLETAQRRLRLVSLDEKAKSAESESDWQRAIEYLETLSKEFPEQESFAHRLKHAQNQGQLAGFYNEAQQLAQAEKWGTVLRVFEEINSRDPNYPDPDGLLERAKEIVSEQELQNELKSLYKSALKAIDVKDWSNAQKNLNQIQTKQMDYRETKRLLQTVKDERARAEQEKQKTEKIASLYLQAENLAARKQWKKSLEKLEDILKVEPDFDDPNQIAAKVQFELEKVRKESEKQDQLAKLYAEAVKLNKSGEYQQALDKWDQIRAIDARYPDKQRIQRTARKNLAGSAMPESIFSRLVIIKSSWIKIVLVAVGIILAGVLFSRGGVLSSLFGPKALFYDNFDDEASFTSTYVEFPEDFQEELNIIGTPDYNFTSLDNSSVIQLKNNLGDFQRKTWEISTVFDVHSNPFRLEIRFNTKRQSPTTSIDGFLEIYLLAADYSNIHIIDLYAGHFGSTRTFMGEPFYFNDNTWYRLVVTKTIDQDTNNHLYKASLYDDLLETELVGVPFDENPNLFQSGMKIGIGQSMGAPEGVYYVDVAVDWIRLSINDSP